MERLFNSAPVQAAVQSPAVSPSVAQFQATAAAETTVDIQWMLVAGGN